MAAGHAIVSSDLEQNLNGKSTSNRSNILDIAVKHLTVSEKGKIKWNGPFEVLKSLMKELTKSEANWTSSGGYCKLLQVNDVTIRWYSDSKSLTLNGSSSEGIKSQIRNIASQVHPEAVTSNNNCSVAGVTALDMDRTVSSEAVQQSKVCKCTCNCFGGITTADLEGLKLDIAILESRFGIANSTDHINSEINSLRSNQRDLEAIIRKQDEII